MADEGDRQAVTRGKARQSQRPPRKRASKALVDACRADFQQARADEAKRLPDPFKYAPLMWEYHERNDTDPVIRNGG
ncbi:hypothetical protein [Kitasatospora sp. NPDC098663]|uniref:hypothetical protein n=1 Tax=Kitasatospora sp. NPDC098663 TaxID=3364096 RepID=UPI0037F6ABD7